MDEIPSLGGLGSGTPRLIGSGGSFRGLMAAVRRQGSEPLTSVKGPSMQPGYDQRGNPMR